MALNENLFDKLRIRPTAKEAVAESAEACCQHPGCTRPGPHRAPMGRRHEGKYFNFCITHVQEYNKTYNYFAGMTDDAVAAYQKDALTGHRPTWTLGVNGKAGAAPEPEILDPLGMFEKARRQKAQTEEAAKPRVGRVAAKAFETLGLDETTEKDAIRARYKALVKRLHPDANGGDRSREDKLREIINAYNTLKSAGLA